MWTYEVDDFRHLDLSKDATTCVCAQIASIPDGEGIRPFDRDFQRFAPVQFGHALDLAECYEITIFQSVPGLVQASH